MKIWALSDPHLSFSTDKPMAVFGPQWENHADRIARAWQAMVVPEDVVVLPGDISWGMNLAEVEADLRFIHELPGQKILGRGNHDYWWTSMRKMELFCREKNFTSLTFLRNNAFAFVDRQGRQAVLCGARGWLTEGDTLYKKEVDEKIFQREVGRLELSLKAGEKLRRPDGTLIAALHYPPFERSKQGGSMIQLLEDYRVDICIFGHVHGTAARRLPELQAEAEIDGITYLNVACDYLQFSPLQIWPEA